MARGSHSFTCHPHVYPRMEWAILHAFRKHSPDGVARARWRTFGSAYYSSIDPERMKGWVGLGGWLHTEIKCRLRESNPDTSPIPVLTGLDVEQLRWYDQRSYHYVTSTPLSSCIQPPILSSMLTLRGCGPPSFFSLIPTLPIPLAQERCVLELWLLQNTTSTKFQSWKSNLPVIVASRRGQNVLEMDKFGRKLCSE